jgi:hypothetical protein
MKFVNYADNIQIYGVPSLSLPATLVEKIGLKYVRYFYFLKTKLFVDSRDLPEISEVISTTRIALLVVTK